VQREDAETFTIAGDIDPDYKAALQKAMEAGVEIVCYDCALDTDRIEVSKPVKLEL
jgi:sugar fermentation stimulation protein A